MKKTMILTTLADCILTLLAGNAFACGERLFSDLSPTKIAF